MHLWSGTYDRPLTNIFAVQDDIAEQVVDQLKIVLLNAIPIVQETDPSAYALFLQANELRRRITTKDLNNAVEMYLEVIAIDANYSAAWERLAGVYCSQANDFLLTPEEGYELDRDAYTQALKIDPDYRAAPSSQATKTGNPKPSVCTSRLAFHGVRSPRAL